MKKLFKKILDKLFPGEESPEEEEWRYRLRKKSVSSYRTDNWKVKPKYKQYPWK